MDRPTLAADGRSDASHRAGEFEDDREHTITLGATTPAAQRDRSPAPFVFPWPDLALALVRGAGKASQFCTPEHGNATQSRRLVAGARCSHVRCRRCEPYGIKRSVRSRSKSAKHASSVG
jgi:hypothetical protein